MRKQLIQEVEKRNAWLLYGDVGYGIIDQEYKKSLNCGIAEQAMLGMASGMAMEGEEVYCYSITPHLLRAWDFVRLFIVHHNLNVKLIGCGFENDYKQLGFSHDIADRDIKALCDAIHLPYAKYPCDIVVGPQFIHVSN